MRATTGQFFVTRGHFFHQEGDNGSRSCGLRIISVALQFLETSMEAMEAVMAVLYNEMTSFQAMTFFSNLFKDAMKKKTCGYAKGRQKVQMN